MKEKGLRLSLIVILLSAIIVPHSIPICSANYTNWGVLDDGSSLHNGTDIWMPHADVEINITRSKDSTHVSMYSEFYIYTTTTQNATLAFVYPSSVKIMASSSSQSGDPGSSAVNFMNVLANGTVMNYTIVTWDDFCDSGFTENYEMYIEYFQPYVNFAVFNTTLIANTTLVLYTISNVTFDMNLDRFDYHYIVGSARTFEGHTIEKVHFHLVEEIPFLSKTFFPDEGLSKTNDGIVTDAIWNLNVTEFSGNYVGLSAVVQRQTSLWTDIITTVCFIGFFVAIVYLFGYKKYGTFGSG